MFTSIELRLNGQQLRGIRMLVERLETEDIDRIAGGVDDVHCLRGALDELRWALKAKNLWNLPEGLEIGATQVQQTRGGVTNANAT